MINIGMVVPGREDATSFYRAWGPFSDLRKSGVDINLVHLDKVSWGSIIDMDIMFVQRPFNKNHIEICQMAKSTGIPVWVDWDDGLWLLGRDNPAYNLYKGCEDTVRMIAKHADIVTCSTGLLAEKLKGVVVKNELPKRFRDIFSPPRKPDGTVRIVWRGSNSHAGDWMKHLVGVLDMKARPEWVLVGSCPFFVTEALVSAGFKVGSVAESFMEQYLMGVVKNDVLKGDIMFVPLKDSEFNRCKSNIAQLEGTAGGMLTVCPSWPEWDRPDKRLGYDKSCTKALEYAVSMVEKGDHVTIVKKLQSRYREGRGDKKRWEIIQGLLGSA